MTGKPKSERCKPEKVYKAIETYYTLHGISPTLEEIGSMVKLAKSGISFYIQQLQGKGWIAYTPGKPRSIRLLKPYQLPLRTARVVSEPMVEIPVWGVIGAGYAIEFPDPFTTLFDPESTVGIRASAIPTKIKAESLVALRVAGNSMMDALIDEGDYVIIFPTEFADPGDMVAVWLPERRMQTLKIIKYEEHRVRLEPRNPDYQPIYVEKDEEIHIQGKVVCVQRMAI